MDTPPPTSSATATHSVVEAKNQLSQLIDRALAGEEIIITRHGKPVVALRPVEKPPRRVTQADLDWLAARRATVTRRDNLDAATLVRMMRDEEDL